MPSSLGHPDALIVVGMQRDLCAGGALAVPGADDLVPVLNGWIDRARVAGCPIVAARDWHPPDHCSFIEQGGPWPPHCVRDTPGAAFHPELRLPDETIVISKGREPDHDNPSAFDDTALADRLRDLGVDRVWIGGLAQDVCVRDTVIDACDAGFETRLIADATRPFDTAPGDGKRALEAMRAAGARIESTPA